MKVGNCDLCNTKLGTNEGYLNFCVNYKCKDFMHVYWSFVGVNIDNDLKYLHLPNTPYLPPIGSIIYVQNDPVPYISCYHAMINRFLKLVVEKHDEKEPLPETKYPFIVKCDNCDFYQRMNKEDIEDALEQCKYCCNCETVIVETRGEAEYSHERKCYLCNQDSLETYKSCPSCCEHELVELDDDYDEGFHGICKNCLFFIGSQELIENYVGKKK